MSTKTLLTNASMLVDGPDTKVGSSVANLTDADPLTFWECTAIDNTGLTNWFQVNLPYPARITSAVIRIPDTGGAAYIQVYGANKPDFSDRVSCSYFTTNKTGVEVGMDTGARFQYYRFSPYSSGTKLCEFALYSTELNYIVIQDGPDDNTSPIKYIQVNQFNEQALKPIFCIDGTTPLTANHADYATQVLKYGNQSINRGYDQAVYGEWLRRQLNPQHKIRVFTPDLVGTAKTITLTTRARTAAPQTPLYRMNYLNQAPPQTPADMTLNVIPKNIFIRPRYLRSMDSYTGVNKVLATYTTSGTGKLLLLVTYDQTTYWTFKTGVWQKCVRYQDIVPDTWNSVAGAWEASTEDGVAAYVEANGMTPTELAAITRNSWDALLVGQAAYGFGILECINSATDVVALDRIDATVDKQNWYRIYDVQTEGMLATTLNATTAAQWKEVFKRTDLDFKFYADPLVDSVSKLQFSVPANTAPKAVNLTLSPSTIHSGIATIKADLIDDEAQNCEYRILLDNVEIKTWTGFKEYVPLLYDIQVAALTPGNHIIKLVTRDEGGAESQYLLNLTVVNFAPTCNVVWNSKRVVASFGDPDGDVISYQMKINGNIVVPYTTYKMNPFLDYRFKPGDLSREIMNIIRIDYVDGTGVTGFWEQQIIGSYFNVTFQDESGAYFSDDAGIPVKILNMGEIMGGEESAIYKVYIKNETGYPITSVDISSNQPFAPDMAVQFSHSDSPFTAVEVLTFPNIIAEGDREYFFVRVSSQESTPSGGEFQIKVRCEVAV